MYPLSDGEQHFKQKVQCKVIPKACCNRDHGSSLGWKKRQRPWNTPEKIWQQNTGRLPIDRAGAGSSYKGWKQEKYREIMQQCKILKEAKKKGRNKRMQGSGVGGFNPHPLPQKKKKQS